MANTKRILIAGAGVAGPALALLLSRVGHKCTIVERADGIRKTGQQIDVSGEGLKVVEMMGIDETIRSRTVHDNGMKFVDADDKVIAAFGVEQTGGSRSLVKEIEIMRPDLVATLWERTRDSVEYIFDDRVTEVTQSDSGVVASFAKAKDSRKFDLLIVADGLGSKTRDLVFPSSNTKIHSLKQYGTFCTLPWQESDGTWSRWYNAPHGRCVCLRPDKNRGTTSGYLCQVTEDSGTVATMPVEEQRKEVVKRFADAGWETDRVMKELPGHDSPGFYLQEIAQAKSASYASGRAALLGDAGYCPSPVSGQGTALAFVGAYILAGCIATYPDHREALEQYEKQMQPFVEKSQKLPPGTPWIVNPQSALGIKTLNNVLWVAGKAIQYGMATALGKVGEWIPAWGSGELKLPDYPALKEQKAYVNGLQ